MSRRREVCRNFLCGSCWYGANCRYLHVIPNQNLNQNEKVSQQRQKPNPFGFGVHNNNSTTKPFENKWIRSASTVIKQTDPQIQGSVHICADPESCKNIIADDFKNEVPLWKLTSYAHYKHLPCDIHGDIRFEELCAAAYEDAKHGSSLQSIVERERNLLQSKLSEFENLLCKPNVPPNSNSSFASQSNPASAFTSFSQLGAVNNGASSFRSPTASSASNNLFGQPSFSHNISHMSIPPEMKFGTPVGSFGSQLTNQYQAFGSLQAPVSNFSFGRASNTNANVNITGSQLFTSPFPNANTSNDDVSNKQQQHFSTLGLGVDSASPPSE